MADSYSHPLAEQGTSFDPTSMPDYDQREEAGEFDGKTPEEIADIYLDEEAENVREQRYDDQQREIDEQEQQDDDD